MLFDPSTSAKDLAEIAAAYPEFAEQIGQHPSAYDELREWLAPPNIQSETSANTEKPGSTPRQTAQVARQSAKSKPRLNRSGPILWIISFATILIVLLIAHTTPVAARSPFVFVIFAALCVGPMVAIIAAFVSPNRQVLRWLSISCSAISILLFLAIILSAVIDQYWAFLQFNIVAVLLLSLAYAFGRPIRNLGWLPFAFLPLGFAAWDLLYVRGIYNLALALIIAILFTFSEMLTRLAERPKRKRVQVAARSSGTTENSDTATESLRTNNLAIFAFIGSFLVSVVGIVLGHIALRQIKVSGEQGRGLAIAGLVIGYASLGIAVFGGIATIIFFVVLAN